MLRSSADDRWVLVSRYETGVHGRVWDGTDGRLVWTAPEDATVFFWP